MESHALHGDGLYYEGGDRLWVSLYAPSTAEWKEAGIRVAMDTDFPEGEAAKLTLTLAQPREFTLAVRRPYWAGDGFAVTVNGSPVERPARAEPVDAGPGRRRSQYAGDEVVGSFVEIQRTWRTGDVVDVTLPKTLRVEPTPDNPRRAALMWGPLVLAGDLGPERGRRGDTEGEALETLPPVPVFVAAERPVAEWLQPVAGTPIGFRTAGVGREPNAEARARDVDLIPFYRLHRRTYATYWDLFTPAEWEERKAEYVAEAERLRKLEAATVAWLQPGETIFERRFNYRAGDGSAPDRILGRPGRRGTSWFSYDLPVEPTQSMTLIATYYSGDRRGTPAAFEIQVDGRRIGHQEVRFSDPIRFYDVEYPIPADLVRGKERVTVRFRADADSQIATVFGLRMVRTDEAR
jgi:hypothetical protein